MQGPVQLLGLGHALLVQVQVRESVGGRARGVWLCLLRQPLIGGCVQV